MVKPTDGLKVAIVLLSLPSFWFLPPRTLALLVRRLGLIFIVLATLKHDMDTNIDVLPKVHQQDLSSFVAVVTGANRGIGLSVCKKLLAMNVTVVMACRSMERCEAAQAHISTPTNRFKLVAMQLDLADLRSVRAFSLAFKGNFSRLDILVNNAGLIAPAGLRTEQGLEASFGIMHIGHFALAKWLLDVLRRHVEEDDRAARVVAVSSAAHLAGDFDGSFFEGDGEGDLRGEVTDNCEDTGPLGLFSCCPALRCPVTNGYSRAKLANILHMHELQIRADAASLSSAEPLRRLVTASLHPGSVSTDIHPNFRRAGMLLRSSDEAAAVVVHAILSDDFVPSSYIDAMKHSYDLRAYRANHLSKHLEAHPEASLKTFAHPPLFYYRSLESYFWNRTPVDRTALAKRLWEVSEAIVTPWE